MSASSSSVPPLRARAMILAAGFGSRLGEIGKRVPKPMLPVCGFPLVRWCVELLRSQGIRDIVINLHHLGEQLEAALGDGRAFDVNIQYSRETEILGTGGGLRHARHLLDDGSDTPIVVMNAKLMLDLNLREMVEDHVAAGAEATMLLRPDAEGIWGKGFRVVGHDRIVEFLGQGASEGQRHMFCGVQVLRPSFLDRIPQEGMQCVVRTAYTELFEQARERLRARRHADYWWEHSTPERYLEGVGRVLRGEAALAHAPSAVTFVDPSAEVAPDAELSSQVWVGPGACIAAGARIGPGVQIGAGARVGEAVELSNAILWDGVHVERSISGAVVAESSA